MTKGACNLREIVLSILLAVLEQGEYSHLVLGRVFKQYDLPEKRDRAFVMRVAEGTIERKLEMDYILNQFSTLPVEKMKPVIRNLLRSGVYQLKYMESVPASAVCNEAVNLAEKKGFHRLKGFVNGILRNIARNMENLTYPAEGLERLSIQYSMPVWILQLWQQWYTAEQMECMLQGFQQEKVLTIRCNLNAFSTEQLEALLAKDGIAFQKHPYLPYAYYLGGYDSLEHIPGFQEGAFAIQDVSSMLVGEVANPPENGFVVDVCGAPGGKSLHVAEKMCKTGLVETRDLTAYKVGMIEKNIARMGYQNMQTKQWDARVLDSSLAGKADIVLADLPCSGLGVIGRKPEIKYRVQEADLQSLAALQRQILSVAQAYVKPGGRLIYSTCTINRGENQENVAWFLDTYPAFSVADMAPFLCEALAEDVQNGCLQLLPGVHLCDGFFISCMEKRAT